MFYFQLLFILISKESNSRRGVSMFIHRERRALCYSIGIVFILSLAIALVFGKSSTADNLPQGSPKLLDAEATHSPFLKGESTTMVIVNLVQPSTAQELRNLEEKAVQAQLNSLVNGTQDQVIRSLDANEIQIERRFSYIFAFSAVVTQKGLQDLINHPQVSSIEPNRILQAHLAQGIPLINASTVRNTYNGSGLAIAICDTGIDYNHPMLGGPGFPNSKVIGGYDTGDNDTDPMDSQGHGTACAGIAAGTLGSNGDYIGGVAYNAKLYAVKIATGSTGNATTAAMIAGWEWCVTHRNDNPAYPIKIISTSFGGGRNYATCDDTTPAMTTAAANAVAAGITVFASSGNDGYCDSMGWPACISHVNSVGAVYDANFGTYYPCVNQYSCAPKTAGGCASGYYATDNTAPDKVTSYSNAASFLTLLASSNRAYTLYPIALGSYDTEFGGTSAACPYAAGAAAALQSAAKAKTGAYLTPAQVRSYLTSTGNLITDGKVAITKPRINLGNAVAALPGGGATNKIRLPLVLKVPPAGSCPAIPNGDFESGHTAWTEYSDHGWDIILYSGFPGGVTPHGGSWAVWLGGEYSDVSYIQQQVTIPSNCPYLTYWHWIASAEESCGYDFARILVNGTPVYSYDLCTTTNTGWKQVSFNLGAYANQSVTLQIRVETDASINSNLFVDDVSFSSSAITSGQGPEAVSGVKNSSTNSAARKRDQLK
jgi:subtilisin family serine protease